MLKTGLTLLEVVRCCFNHWDSFHGCVAPIPQSSRARSCGKGYYQFNRYRQCVRNLLFIDGRIRPEFIAARH